MKTENSGTTYSNNSGYTQSSENIKYEIQTKTVDDLDNSGVVPRWTSYRNALAGWGFWACLCVYILRINFSVAIVCMTFDPVDNTTKSENRTVVIRETDPWQVFMMGTYDEVDCSSEDDEPKEETGEFDWDRQLRGTLTSSFFWGYVLTQIIGGWLAQMFGGKKVIAYGMVVSIVTSFLSPPAARLSPYALLAMRFINGLGQGVFFPAYYCMAGFWFPLVERAFLLTLFGVGANLGAALSFALSGFLCAEFGWQWVFWSYSMMSIVWLICWIFLVYDTPAQHPRISKAERDFIESSLPPVLDKVVIPWRSILTDATVWCMIVTDFCNNWASYAGLTQLPQYMEDVLQFNISENGLYNSVPQLVKLAFGFIFALIGDYIVTLNIISTTFLRKIMTTICMLLPMCFVIGVGYLDCSTAPLAILLITLQELFNAAQRAGYHVSRIDIAPRFSGITLGLFNTSGNIAGIFAPLTISIITSEGTRSQWQTCFFMSAAMYLIGWLSFTIFGTSEIKEWAKVGNEDTKEVSRNEVLEEIQSDINNKEGELYYSSSGSECTQL